MVLVEDADDHDGSRVAAALQLAERLLAGKAAASQPGVQQMSPQSMAMAVAAANEAGNKSGLAQISVPGAYAAAEALKAISHPETVAKLKDLGAIPAPMGAAQLDKFWKADFDYWRPVVQSVKLD